MVYVVCGTCPEVDRTLIKLINQHYRKEHNIINIGNILSSAKSLYHSNFWVNLKVEKSETGTFKELVISQETLYIYSKQDM